MSFWREAFSDNGTPSSSRVLTAIHSFCAIGVILNFSWHNHGAIPDFSTIGGLATFSTVHYAVNRFSQGSNKA